MHAVSFRCRDQAFYLPMRAVYAIPSRPPITPLPGAPAWLIGACNLDGRVVSVIDLAALSGQPPAPVEGLIVVETREGLISLVTTSAPKTVHTHDPPEGNDWSLPYLDGQWIEPDQMVLFLTLFFRL